MTDAYFDHLRKKVGSFAHPLSFLTLVKRYSYICNIRLHAINNHITFMVSNKWTRITPRERVNIIVDAMICDTHWLIRMCSKGKIGHDELERYNNFMKHYYHEVPAKFAPYFSIFVRLRCILENNTM